MIDIERVMSAAKILIQQDFAQNLTEIALVCGKSKQYFSDLKRKKSYPSIKFVDVFCEKYPVNKDYILTGNGEILLSAPAGSAAQVGEVNNAPGGTQNISNNVANGENYGGVGNSNTVDPSISELLKQQAFAIAELTKTNAQLVAMLAKQQSDNE